MTSNSFFLHDSALERWDLDQREGLPWPDCDYVGDVLEVVDERRPDLGIRFVLTKDVRAVPITGDDVVVVCIGDELAQIPRYAGDVRLVAKTYGTQRPFELFAVRRGSLRERGAVLAQEVSTQLRRLPAFARTLVPGQPAARASRIVDIPLGTYLLQPVPFVPFWDRPLDASFVGSRFSRWFDNRRRTLTPKTRSRVELEQAVADVCQSRPDLQLSTQLIHAFHDAAENADAYSETMMHTRIALCPRGGSLETYRFFEALRFGCVPVTEPLPRRDYYTGSPAVGLARWAQLTDVLDRLLSDRDALFARHQAALEWWAGRCSPEAVAARILDRLAAVPA